MLFIGQNALDSSREILDFPGQLTDFYKAFDDLRSIRVSPPIEPLKALGKEGMFADAFTRVCSIHLLPQGLMSEADIAPRLLKLLVVKRQLFYGLFLLEHKPSQNSVLIVFGHRLHPSEEAPRCVR